jgi:hypothetical protein
MITAHDWKRFNQQTKILQEMDFASWLQSEKKNREEDRKNQEKYMAALQPGQLARFGFFPMRPHINRWSVSAEKCMDWIVAGRPTLARKLKVKDLND